MTALVFAISSVQSILSDIAVDSGSLLLKVITGGMLCGLMALLALAIRANYTLTPLSSVPRYLKLTLSLILAWSLVVVIRSLSWDPKEVADIFGANDTAWLWLAPAAALLGYRVETWGRSKFIFSASLHIGILVCAALFIRGNDNEYMTENLLDALLYPAALFLLSSYLSSSYASVMAMIAVVIWMINSLAIAWRHLVISSSYVILAYLALCIFASAPGKRLVKLFIIGYTLLSLFIPAYLVYSEVPLVKARVDESVFRFDQKLLSDSRSQLYEDFFDDLSVTELIFGRGVLGKYTSFFNGLNWTSRFNIECGYLTFVLKGGMVMLVLFLMMAIPAAYLGIFNSANPLAKAGGIIILGRLIDMVPYGMPVLSPNYILFWMCVGLCYNTQARWSQDAILK